jgi:hypothetical protein
MLRISMSSAFALAVLAAPMVASAAGPEDSAFDAFAQVCMDSGADYPTAVKVADANGWGDTELNATLPAGVSNTDKAARAKMLDKTNLSLFLTRGVGKNGLMMSTCTVNSDHGSLGDVPGRVQAWFGVAPLHADGESATFHVGGGKGAWHTVADGDIEASVGAPGGLSLVNVKIEDGVLILDYIKVTK